jgi:putative ABC transport system permease protein
MPMLVRLALRNLSRHAWRTAATVLGVAIGIAAVLATLSVGDNVEANVESTLAAAAGEADLLVTPGVQGRAVFATENVRSRLEADPDVTRVYPVLNVRAEPVREAKAVEQSVIPGVDTGFQISGRVTSASEDLPARTSKGSLPAAGSLGVAIAENFAAQRGMRVGDSVSFVGQLGTLDLQVTGLLDGSYGYASTNGGRVAVVALEDLQSLLHLEGRASYLELHVRDAASTGEVLERLSSLLGDDYTVTYPAASGNIATGIVDTIQSGLSILAVTLLALGGFMAYNTFMAGVVERRREFALLRTLCLTKAQVKRLALLEAAVVSLLGVVTGLLLGIVLAYTITRINAFSLGIEFRTLVLPLESVLPAAGVGVLVALLAGSLPARTASATPPLAALRQAEEYDGTPRRTVVGWLLVASGVAIALLPWNGAWALAAAGSAMALLFLGFTLATPSLLSPALRLVGPLLHRLMGPPGKLGASFARRNAPRNGVAIGSVVVGMGLTIGTGAMVAGINKAIADWVDTTIVGDLFVTSPVSFPADFEATVPERVAGVDAVSGVGIRIVRFQPQDEGRARSIALVLVDPERFAPESGFGRFQYIPGQGSDLEGYRALSEGRRVLIANTLRDRFDIGRGDEVELRTDEGFRRFPVAGVIVDFTGGGEAVVGSIEDMDLFGGGTPDLYVMTVEPGVDAAEARERLVAAYPQLYLDVTLNRDYREAIMELTRRSFVTTNALLALAIFIAALGVANTLGMNLSNRKHELAVLRTFGLTRRGVGRVVTAEGLVVLMVGAILGVGSGLLLAHVITAGAAAITGFTISPRYPWTIVVAAIVASPLVGYLSSYFPARRAARLPPILALGASE